jgi:hypothetical protein
MERILKVLLPLYRATEMRSEISSEYLMDCKGHVEEGLTFNMLSKSLFRVAHWWCTHIDLEEYLDMLQKIFDRITVRRVIR